MMRLRHRDTLAAAFVLVISLEARPAYAMHISEGLLPLGWSAFWWLLSLPFAALGIRKLRRASRADLSITPLVGLLSAVVFIVSCMPVPVPTAGTCSHPCGTAISGVLLGPAISVLVAAAALLIQALFLAHGGLSTLGANVIAMGVVGSFTGFLVFRFSRRLGAGLAVSGFLAGISADWMTYATTSFVLASGLQSGGDFLPLFIRISAAFLPTQAPIGVLEGAMTAGMVVLLHRKRPDLLVRMKVLRPEEAAVCAKETAA
ncbi:MAG: hypothetical protein OHK006_14110 [Thermodesulfovibrionales bacterium]